MQEKSTKDAPPTRFGFVYCYAPLWAIDDYLRLGWVPTKALQHTHHGEHAVLCVWQCGCEPPMPKERYDD